MSKVHDEQRRWLAERLKEKGWGAKSALAAYLGLRNEAITRILTAKDDRGCREISFDELVKMSDFFRSTPPGINSLSKNSDREDRETHEIIKSESEQKKAGISNATTSMIEQSTTIPRGRGSVIPQAELVGDRDLPVYGLSHDRGGAVVLSGSAVEFAARPEPLLKVPEGYGVIVADDSMSPEHGIGSIALIHPHLPAKVGDTCVFRRLVADGGTEVLIKQISRITPTTWHVSQHKPEFTTTLKRAEWDTCHVTVGNYKRR